MAFLQSQMENGATSPIPLPMKANGVSPNSIFHSARAESTEEETAANRSQRRHFRDFNRSSIFDFPDSSKPEDTPDGKEEDKEEPEPKEQPQVEKEQEPQHSPKAEVIMEKEERVHKQKRHYQYKNQSSLQL